MASKRTFEKETFSPSNLNRYNRCLLDYERATPVLFFLASTKRPGKAHHKHIFELETLLIQLGAARNPELLNEKGKMGPRWQIAGTLRSMKWPNKAARSLKLAFDFPKRKPRRKPDLAFTPPNRGKGSLHCG